MAQDNPISQIFPLQDLGLALTAAGQYTEALQVYERARQLSLEHEVWPGLARTLANLGGLHLDVFDYAGSEALAEEARVVARAADFVLAEVSAGIDLLFNFARRQEVGRAEKLVAEVAKAVAIARGSHGWLWQLRFAQARAELACAAGEWEEALRLAAATLQRSGATGRVRYQALALKTRAQAVAALGHTPDAVVDLKNALDVTRPTGDPALLLQIAAALLALEGDAALAQEASAAAERIRAALPNDEMRHSFEVADPVRLISTLAR